MGEEIKPIPPFPHFPITYHATIYGNTSSVLNHMIYGFLVSHAQRLMVTFCRV